MRVQWLIKNEAEKFLVEIQGFGKISLWTILQKEKFFWIKINPLDMNENILQRKRFFVNKFLKVADSLKTRFV